MAVIKKSKNQGNNRTDVFMPVYAGTLSTADWNTITNAEITNRIVGSNGTEGARSFMQIVRLSSIDGRKVGMLVKEGEKVTKDIVTVIGMTNTDVIVKFEDEDTEYSIKRPQVRFVLGVE